MATKNPCSKTRPVTRPYEIWEGGGFTWRVLKKYQNPEREAANPHARWLVSCDSPFITNEQGDEYVTKIKSRAVLTHTDYDV